MPLRTTSITCITLFSNCLNSNICHWAGHGLICQHLQILGPDSPECDRNIDFFVGPVPNPPRKPLRHRKFGSAGSGGHKAPLWDSRPPNSPQTSRPAAACSRPAALFGQKGEGNMDTKPNTRNILKSIKIKMIIHGVEGLLFLWCHCHNQCSEVQTPVCGKKSGRCRSCDSNYIMQAPNSPPI